MALTLWLYAGVIDGLGLFLVGQVAADVLRCRLAARRADRGRRC